MNCGCMNRKFGQEIDRIRRLAKAWAQCEESTVVIYKNADGTYGYTEKPELLSEDKPIVEYITPY